jgi:dipeptidyl aminopeptidase/acylaminoacyl peptidase
MSVRSQALVPSLVLVGLLAAAPGVSAQKPSLDHDDYDRWIRIQGDRLSNDGRWLAFSLVPGEGDPTLQVKATEGGASLMVARATGPRFSANSRWVVATVSPAHAVVDSMRRAKVDRDDLPGDSLVVIDLGGFSGSGFDGDAATTRLGEIRSFGLSEEGNYLAVHLPAPEDDEAEPESDEPPGADEDEDEEARDRGRVGTPLLLRDLTTGREHRFEEVTSFVFTDDGRHLFLTRTTEDGAGDGVLRVATGSGDAIEVASGPGQYSRLSVQPDGHRAVFLTDRDADDEEAGTMAVYVADDAGVGRLVAQASSPGMPSGWAVSSDESPSLSPSGTRVFFGARMPSIPVDPALEDQLDDEVVRLDVWSWTDDRLQPMQLLQLEDDTTQAYLSLVSFGGGEVVPLATPDVPTVRLVDDGDGDVALGISDVPYRTLVSWDASYSDAYVVDLAGGMATLVGEKLRGSARISPEGRWVYWWDGDRRGWFARSSAGGEEIALTAGLPHPVHNELDDHPDAPGSYGEAGWTEDDGSFLVYDRHDLWAIDPTRPGSLRSVTDGLGRREGLRFRLVDTDPDEEAVPTDTPVLLSAFDLRTKQSGLYRDRLDGAAEPVRLRMDDAQISTPQRARHADRFLFTRQTFTDFPDLWVSGPDFDDAQKLSEANPQQEEVRWGTAELVEWVSNDGEPLQGILYKPEGFDESRAWPMMVYFYERSSDGLHRYVVPAAGGSSINYSFYVSRGYLVFVPDIPYEIGHPGESALDAVVPGIQALANRGFVDRDRIGVQGHSWGGYQIAWMITRTNLFAAAEAGAPVANMTSAYGGIRWGTGMSRMFQYERTQSRIGGTLWEAPMLYIQNSPLFALDKVQTPLLMMHNDEDTAVPWEQGIELFVALRRLQKPAWLLNYNGEAHGLGREANRKDWAERMQQFFDHYLMDAPAPEWMEQGVPALFKGKSLGLDVRKPIG